MTKRYPLLFRATAGTLFILALGTLLIIGRDFLYPLAIAALFAYLLYPVAHWLEKRGVPRILANLICILASVALIIVLVNFISSKLMLFMQDLPNMQAKASRNLAEIQATLDARFHMHHQPNWLKAKVFGFLNSSGGVISNAVSGTTSTIVKVGLIPVYVFFFLYYRDKYKAFICKLIPERKHAKADVVIEETSMVMRKYMAGVVTVVIILCILNSTGLMLIGLDYALLFGILSAMLNFIPYFGTLIGGIIPLTYTILISDSPHKALAVVILYLCIQFIDHNILTPNITGGYVRISPFIIILSIILGSMIWGLPGMIVSVPYLAAVKIICEHIEPLKPVAFLLSDKGTTKHALTWAKVKAFFGKRLKSKPQA